VFVVKSCGIMWLGAFGRILVCTVVILSSAVLAQAEGKYQRTKDGKTLVWNEHPRPGDVATWSGRRDSDGYAKGFGTLTWYRTESTRGTESKQMLYAYYFGNMVRGQFDGPVNSHSNGATSHAVFSDGRLMSRWVAGSVTSWTMPRPPVETFRSENPSTSVALQRRSENSHPSPETRDAIPEAGMSKPSNAQVAEFHPAPKSYGAMPSERPRPNYEAVHEETKSEPTVEAPGEGPPPGEPRSNNGNAKLEVDSSLRALTGPPPALGRSESGRSDLSASISSKQDHLSKADVVNLSDSEARKRGYDLSRYDRPDPQFDPHDNTWSLSYAGKTTSAGAPSPKRFTVAIDDKTKRTAIVPAR
jgi:hypothetical protein